MADLDVPDEQDQSEVFDEDNTELEEQRYGGHDNGETLEELPDVFDVTRAVGDADDDESEIGEDLDDEEIVARARENDGDDDLEDDDLVRSEEIELDQEEDLTDIQDGEDPDERDGIDAHDPDEVELEYVGDLNDVAAAASAAQSLESERLSDADLRELDYKDEFTRDDDQAASSAP